MINFEIDESLLATLSPGDKQLVKTLVGNIKSDAQRLVKFCEFVEKKIEDKDGMHLSELSEDIKFQACIGHLVVSLLSGRIHRSELKPFI